MSRSSKGRWVVLLTVMMVFGVAGNAAAHGTVDQSSESRHERTPCLMGFTVSMAQTFTPTADNLTGIGVHMSGVDPASEVELTIRTASATGAVLATVANIPLSDGWNHIDLAGPIALIPGNTYAIRLDRRVGHPCWSVDKHNPYLRGQGWHNRGHESDWDFNFRTYDEEDVPDNEPPVADPNGPYLVGAGASVAFDGSGSSDPDGDSLTFDWVADAGTFDDATAVQPTYNAPAAAGTYTVTLTVDDGNGVTDTESTDVVVYEPDLKERKRAVLDDLSALDPTGKSKKDDKKLEKAVEHLTKSLNPDYWVDGDTLVAKDGKKVFAEESKAVKDLEKIKSTDVSEAIASLVAIDKQLALGAIEDAWDAYYAVCSDPTTKECEKAAKELDKAAKELDKAAKELDKGHFAHAIGKYKKAWEKADKALRALPELDLGGDA